MNSSLYHSIMIILLGAWFTFIVVVFAEQQPLWSEPFGCDSESYRFSWPIHKVAIIGAGPSGLITYREFAQMGFDVWLFERDFLPGGNWHYTEEKYANTPIPNIDVSVGDFVPSLPPEGVALPYEEHYEDEVSREVLRVHRAPKPIWKSLQTNAPHQIEEFPELPWPAGLPWQLPNDRIAQYIRAFASYHGINSNDIENPRIRYNTRVELVERLFNSTEHGPVRSGWTLTLKEMLRTGRNTSKAVWTKEDFDAVVIATGKFNAPYIPDIPGIKAWADRFPDRVIHSRQYRRPQPYVNQTVLIVGAGDSATQIATDIAPHTRPIYISVRQGKSRPLLPYVLRLLPSNVTVVPEINHFSPPDSSIATSRIELKNGSILTGIDTIIFATGYRYSFPFLPQFHNSSTVAQDIDLEPIVTDGTHLRNLYLDMLSIDEPTLGFMSMNPDLPVFGYSEYFAVALAKIWGNLAKLPSTPQLRKWCEEYVLKKGGYRKGFQFLGFTELNARIRFLVGWLNEAAVKFGGRQISPKPPGDFQILSIWIQATYGINIFAPDNSTHVGPSLLHAVMPSGWNRHSFEQEQAWKRIHQFLYGRDW